MPEPCFSSLNDWSANPVFSLKISPAVNPAENPALAALSMKRMVSLGRFLRSPPKVDTHQIGCTNVLNNRLERKGILLQVPLYLYLVSWGKKKKERDFTLKKESQQQKDEENFSRLKKRCCCVVAAYSFLFGFFAGCENGKRSFLSLLNYQRGKRSLTLSLSLNSFSLSLGFSHSFLPLVLALSPHACSIHHPTSLSLSEAFALH